MKVQLARFQSDADPCFLFLQLVSTGVGLWSVFDVILTCLCFAGSKYISRWHGSYE